MVAPLVAAMVPGVSGDPEATRALAKRISEACEDANFKASKNKAKGTTSGKHADVTGKLIETRSAAEEACASLAIELGRGGGRGSLAKKLKVAFKRARTPILDKVQAAVDKCERCLAASEKHSDLVTLATEVDKLG